MHTDPMRQRRGKAEPGEGPRIPTEDENRAYFLLEAPELLDQIETALVQLRQDPSHSRIHTLMRSAHTLKGAAASVGLEGIKRVAHELEDSFKALYDPQVQIDALWAAKGERSLESLLYQGVERLRQPIQIMRHQGQISDAQVWAQAEPVFTQLRQRLGEAWQHGMDLPSGVELGFDVAQSIFEMGVQQRLETLEALLIDPEVEPAQIIEQLQAQAQVFLGLAESLDLKGFQAIAATVLQALQQHPQQGKQILEIALKDLRQGQAAVLAGDRVRGGEVSPQLQHLATLAGSSQPPTLVRPWRPTGHRFDESDHYLLDQIWGKEAEANPPLPTQPDQQLLDTIWGDLAIPEATEAQADQAGIEDLFWDLEQAPLASATMGQIAPGTHEILFDSPDLFFEIEGEEQESEFTSLADLAQLWGGGDRDPEEPQRQPEPTAMDADLTIDPELIPAVPSSRPSGQLPNLEASERDPLLEAIYSSASPRSSQHSQEKREFELRSDLSPQLQASAFRGGLFSGETEDLLPAMPSLQELLIGVEGLDTLGPTLMPWQSSWLHPAPPLPPPKIPLPTQPQPTIRVEIETLDSLNHLMANLITVQHQQCQYQEDLQTSVTLFQDRLQAYGHHLMDLQDCSDQLWEISTPYPVTSPFDPLELDRYSELQILIQTLLDERRQLQEAGDAVELYTHQLGRVHQQQQRLLNQTRDTLMQARMAPLGDLFQRFPGLIQQLSITQEKSVQLTCRGEDLWVDKVIGEKLYDPLLHLIRNAFAHGIESPTQRRQRGKPDQGQIVIEAVQQGNRLTIEVGDDGQGLPFDQIRQQGITSGRIPADQADQLATDQMIEWIFEPGFSTAQHLSDLSGRGIGLDVVRSQLRSLGGEVQIQSQPHQGTRFLLQIPLSLTITQLLLCQVGSHTYALPTDTLDQILLPNPDQILNLRGQRVLRWQSSPALLPIYALGDLCHPTYAWPSHPNPTASPETERPLVIFDQLDHPFALEVEGLIGEQDLVIKPFDALFDPPAYVYGCSPLGDGRLALVIDAVAWVRQIHPDPRQNQAPRLPAANLGVANPKPQILVVDDSMPCGPPRANRLRQTLTTTLERAQYQVTPAADGQAALDLLRQQPSAFSAVICDIEMPHINGFEFLTQQQADQEIRQVPVVILTSPSGAKHRQLALELGARAYLTKPFQAAELLSLLAEIGATPHRAEVSQ